MSRGGASAILGFFVFLMWSASIASAQDLEPRAYAASPVGLSFLAVIAGHSSGGVLVDPSLPLEDVRASVNSFGVGFGRTFDLFGRTALAVAVLPLAWVDASGRVGENAAQVSREGLADPRLKLSVNLIGGRALTSGEFAQVQRRTIVGVSLSAIPPLGQYDPTKLINLGANRWAFKPEIGISRLVRSKWTLDGYAGIWIPTANDEFYPGESHRTQRPIVALQAHVSYTARPRLWIAADGTWYSGGRTTIDGIDKQDLQRNSRLGATLSLPIARSQSLKINGSVGATTRAGSDFRTIAVAWQMSWLR
jgi:Putative MetA-pathway of phenol degradation